VLDHGQHIVQGSVDTPNDVLHASTQPEHLPPPRMLLRHQYGACNDGMLGAGKFEISGQIFIRVWACG
jgi:hypothetical protein